MSVKKIAAGPTREFSVAHTDTVKPAQQKSAFEQDVAHMLQGFVWQILFADAEQQKLSISCNNNGDPDLYVHDRDGKQLLGYKLCMKRDEVSGAAQRVEVFNMHQGPDEGGVRIAVLTPGDPQTLHQVRTKLHDRIDHLLGEQKLQPKVTAADLRDDKKWKLLTPALIH